MDTQTAQDPYTIPKKDRNDSLIKDYLEGMSIVGLIKKYEISTGRIYAILKANKIDTFRKP